MVQISCQKIPRNTYSLQRSQALVAFFRLRFVFAVLPTVLGSLEDDGVEEAVGVGDSAMASRGVTVEVK
jgi:hypothetical protein